MEKNTTSVGEERVRGINKNSGTDLNENPLPGRLVTGKYRMYHEYLEWLGFNEETKILILSPNNHYYYDDDELRDVNALLNLKHLNHIKEVKGFLYSVSQALANKSYLIGSFIDRKHQFSFFANSIYPDKSLQEGVDPVENGISSRIPLLNMIYDFMDSRTNNRNMTKKSVTLLLEITGFKVLDMTEINGITCFCAQKNKSS
ncbi:MAG: hypothetical protein ACM3NR_00540 [Methanosarcina sp.]